MKKNTLFLFFFALCLGFSTNSRASHIAGGEITYRYIGDSTNIARHYLLRLTLYQDMSGINLGSSANLVYTSSCNSGGTIQAPLINSSGNMGVPIQSPYDCVGINQPGVINYAKWVFEVDVTLPTNCNDWEFYWQSCCRNPAITNLANASSQGFVIKSLLNNNFGPNSSPFFASDAARHFCSHSPQNLVLSQQAFDVDGDSLFYYFAQPLDDPYPGVPIPFQNGFSVQNPISTFSGMNLNPATGVMIFRPTAVEVDVFKINVDEFRFDTASTLWINIGTITRELQIPILNNCSQAAINWTLQLNNSTTNKIVASCGTQELEFNTSVPIDCGSISPDGTDFLIYRSDGTLLPVVSASGVCNFGYSNTIRIQLHDTISQNDSMHIISYVGSDFNTLINYCGFSLPVGDSITVVVRDCPNIGLEQKDIISGIYPNPFKNDVKIEFEDNSPKELFIFNSNGQLLLERSISEKTYNIDLKELPKGLYILQVKESDHYVTKKIVKK